MIFTNYRLYPNGEVVHQDDFHEKDCNEQPYDDYIVVVIPDEVVLYIEEAAS